MAAALFLAAFFGARQAAVAAIPDLAGLYAAVGLPVNLDGLAIEDVGAERTPTFAGFKLKVHATVRNIGKSEGAAMPPLAAVLLDDRRTPSGTYGFDPPAAPSGRARRSRSDGIRQRAASRRRRWSCGSAGAGRRSPSLARPSRRRRERGGTEASGHFFRRRRSRHA